MRSSPLLVSGFLIVLFGCASSAPPTTADTGIGRSDGATDSGTPTDTGVVDTGVVDTSVVDTDIVDTGIVADTGLLDSGVISDSGDAALADTSVDTRTSDAAIDMGTVDMGMPDTGVADSGNPEAGADAMDARDATAIESGVDAREGGTPDAGSDGGGAPVCDPIPVRGDPIGGLVTRYRDPVSAAQSLSTFVGVSSPLGLESYSVDTANLFYAAPYATLGSVRGLVPIVSCGRATFHSMCVACPASTPYVGVLGYASSVALNDTLPLRDHFHPTAMVHRFVIGSDPPVPPYEDRGVIAHVWRAAPVSLASTMRVIPAAGGMGSIELTAAPGQAWSATSEAGSWLMITSTPAGAGSGTISFMASANTGSARLGSIRVGDQTIGVIQSGAMSALTDVAVGATFSDYINLMRSLGINSGCGPDTYCPSALVTRREMARYVIRAAVGTGVFMFSATPYFSDVPSSDPDFRYIQKMRELGVTTGCGGGNYCPDSNVTRAQMAAFLIRAAHTDRFAYTTTPHFTDVASDNVFFPYVQKMRDLGITQGCSPTTYCPDMNIPQEQMAVFVVRAFFGAP